MSTYEQELAALYTEESFALAQGREDLLDEIDRKRRLLTQQHEDLEYIEAREAGLA